MSDAISVIIPTIPPRADRLVSAIRSVSAQIRPAAAIHVAVDVDKQGAPITRDRALAAVQTPWVAPLDDDDTFYPPHLEALLTHAKDSGADLIYPWFDVVDGGTDPFPDFFGQPWDDEHPHQIPVTFLARTDALRDVGGFSRDFDLAEDPGTDPLGNRAGEDYRLVLRLVEAGARIVHLPHRTWAWSHWGQNTSGLPSRW